MRPLRPERNPASSSGSWHTCIMNPMTNDLEQLRGEVERLVYSSEESGFTICRLVVPGRGDLVTVAGTMPGIQPGERLHLRGRWINHPIHGYQLDFTHFKRHKRGNLQYDGTEWRGVSVHRSWRSIVKNPPVQRQLLLPVPSIILAGSPPVSDCAAGPLRCGSWGRRIPG